MAIIFVFFLTFFTTSLATHCDTRINFMYHHSGSVITCEDLSKDNEDMLKNIRVSDEIVLTIKNSNLTNVTADLFHNIPKIRYLYIINSTFQFDPAEKVFANFAKLESLIVKDTQFNNLNAQVLSGMDKLREINLQNCSLSIIRNETFKALKKLEYLKLPYNHFRSLFDIPFCELTALKFVDLDHNEIQEIEENFLVCFEEEDESGFMLNGREHEIFHKNNFHQTKSTFNIIQLNLSYNRIERVGSFDWATGMKYLDLSSNRLRNITENSFNTLTDLAMLNLKNNLIEVIHENVFTKLQSLKVLNLENNTLSKVSLVKLVNLEEISLAKNLLKSNSLTHISNLHYVRKLFLDYNQIETLPSNVFNSFTHLDILDLSNNKLRLSKDCFKRLVYLTHLYLCNNSLELIAPNPFRDLSNLISLDISTNKLGPVLNKETFSGLENLRVLNMSNNLLEEVSYHLLKPLRKLKLLDVSGNRLRDFQIKLISPSIHGIIIKSNLLSCSVLSRILTEFKLRGIGYRLHADFEYDSRENVDGIYCEGVSSRLQKNQEKGVSGQKNQEKGVSVGIVFLFIFLVAISSACFSFVFFKCFLFAKRRRYLMVELEML